MRELVTGGLLIELSEARTSKIKGGVFLGGGGVGLQNKQNVLPAVCPFLPVSQQPCWPPCSSGGDNSRI